MCVGTCVREGADTLGSGHGRSLATGLAPAHSFPPCQRFYFQCDFLNPPVIYMSHNTPISSARLNDVSKPTELYHHNPASQRFPQPSGGCPVS